MVDDDKIFWSIIGFGALAVCTWLFLPDGWRIKYVIRYLTPYEHISIEERPTLCDWSRAPLGNKACHYEKNIRSVMWDKSKDGMAISSDDEGITWKKTWIEGTPADVLGAKLPLKNIIVSWTRVEEP